MNVKIQNRHLQLTQNLQRLVERQSKKVGKLLPTFASHDLDLHVTLEKLPRGKQYHTVLVLTMPQNVIRVEEVENNLTTSVLRSFEELLRRIKKFKSRLNREKFWQKEPGLPDRTVLSANTRELENAINQNLDKVENYIRRELYYHSTLDNFPAGILQPQALVDEVFLEVSSQATSRPENVPLEQWMFQIARNAISQRIEALRVTLEQPHIEETAPRQSQWEDEELHFHQPDEVIRLEDLMSDDHSVSPEEAMEQEEAREQLQKAIAKLPGSLRESLVLFALEGFNADEIAMITGKKSAEVLDDVEEARHQLRYQTES
jgi:RNA polymerase sigma factor (sigma-70 family)